MFFAPGIYRIFKNRRTKNKNIKYNGRHYFNDIHYAHIPFFLCLKVFFLIFFFVLFLNKFLYIEFNFVLWNLLGIVFYCTKWFFDISLETTILGRYTKKVRSALVFGFILFLLSEIMLFAGFFWSFFDRIFHLSYITCNMSQLNGFELIKWYKTPLAATLVLVTSGYILNYAYYLFKLRLAEATPFAEAAWLLAILFLWIQANEYIEVTFTIADSVYASLFFLLTGFHGVHVIVGTIFLTYAVDSMEYNTYTDTKHIGFGIAIIYWHFVDIIWIFLFIFIYMLNSWDFIILAKKLKKIAYLIR